MTRDVAEESNLTEGKESDEIRRAIATDGEESVNDAIATDGETAVDNITDATDQGQEDVASRDEPKEALDQLADIEVEYHKFSIPYLSLLNYVSNKEHLDKSEQTQFMLMRGSLRREQYDPIFISHFHDLEE